MLYLIKDKRGITISILEISTSRMTTFQVNDAVAQYVKTNCIKCASDYYCVDLQKYLWKNYNVRSVERSFDVANLKV
jgi:hypothetical protein